MSSYQVQIIYGLVTVMALFFAVFFSANFFVTTMKRIALSKLALEKSKQRIAKKRAELRKQRFDAFIAWLKLVIITALQKPQVSYAGPIVYRGINYASANKAAAILGIDKANIESELDLMNATKDHDSIWKNNPTHRVALQHRCLPIGRSTTSRLFIADYNDGKSIGIVSRKSGKTRIKDEVFTGKSGDSTLLDLAKSA